MLKLSVVSGAAGAAGQRAGGREPSVRVEVVCGVRSWLGWLGREQAVGSLQCVLKLSVVSGAAGAAGQRAGSRESSVRVEVVCGVRSCWGGWAESRQ